jgi:hypothetical protein
VHFFLHVHSSLHPHASHGRTYTWSSSSSSSSSHRRRDLCRLDHLDPYLDLDLDLDPDLVLDFDPGRDRELNRDLDFRDPDI